jgi:hypothetical protein
MPPTANWLQASQRFVYVSQKCTELHPERVTPADPGTNPHPNISHSARACSFRQQSRPKEGAFPARRSDLDCCPSLFLVLCRGGGPCFGPGTPRPVHAQRSNGIELGRQRLHHQPHPTCRQCHHRILFPPLAPESPVIDLTVHGDCSAQHRRPVWQTAYDVSRAFSLIPV